MEWMLMPYRKLYRLIEGRSGRREFWMFTLLCWIVALGFFALMAMFGAGAASMFGGAMGGDPTAMLAGAGVGMILVFAVFYIWLLLTGVASFAVTVRRLHDLGFSGWFIVLFYAILIAAVMINVYLYFAVALGWIVVMALPGNQGANKYGPNPYDVQGGAEVFA